MNTTKKIRIAVIITALLAILSTFIFIINNSRAKSFYDAIGLTKDEFLSLDWRKSTLEGLVVLEKTELEQINGCVSKYTLKSMSHKEFNDKFTAQNVLQLRNKDYFIQIGETFVSIAPSNKKQKFYEILN